MADAFDNEAKMKRLRNWQNTPETDGIDSWYEPLKAAVEKNGEDFSKLICVETIEELKRKFTIRQGYNFTAWGEKFVYFGRYDNVVNSVGMVPRNPTPGLPSLDFAFLERVNPRNLNWYTLLKKEIAITGDDIFRIQCTLTTEGMNEVFDNGFGREFVAWGDRFIYFNILPDGFEFVGWVHRNPPQSPGVG